MKETVLYFLFGKFAGGIRKPSTLIKIIGYFWHDLHAGTLSKTYCFSVQSTHIARPIFLACVTRFEFGKYWIVSWPNDRICMLNFVVPFSICCVCNCQMLRKLYPAGRHPITDAPQLLQLI